MLPIPANLVGLTLYPTPDGGWQASVTFDRVSWRVEIDDDPWKALSKVLRAEQAPEQIDLEDLF